MSEELWRCGWLAFDPKTSPVAPSPAVPGELVEAVARAADPGAFTTRPGDPEVFVFSEADRCRARDRASAAIEVVLDRVKARVNDLGSHRNSHWSDAENRAYSLGVRNAVHVIEILTEIREEGKS